eukprot:TRINITY_DN15732_c0_g1_i1.p2 TRINITY_DN15732_c0_g1~~TRINITY_DN15732_c0_g1_i1.p2  ORF type:complete len:370 (-),score=14.09 TRINITY_DN15732_c0_g1_i1:73-1182(-)
MYHRRLLGDDLSSNWWIYVIIPVISALVGYFTNALAIQMSFWPLDFIGIKIWQPKGSPFGIIGWQGIIPCKGTKMASILVDIMVNKLLDVKEVFGRVDPYEVTKLCEQGMKVATKRIVDGICEQEMPQVWQSLPADVKTNIYKTVFKDSSSYVRVMLEMVKEHAFEVIDIKHMVISEVEQKKHLMVQLFQQVGSKEFGFLRNSGLVFGFLFGLIQALIYYFYKGWWILPLFGFLVGWITNYVAIKLIFEPAKPVNMGCFTLQGAFLKRQKEASAKVAELAQDYFLQQSLIWNEILTGAYREKFDSLLDDAIKKHLQQYTTTASKLAINLILGWEYYQEISTKVVELLEQELPSVVPYAYKYMEHKMSIR